MHMSQQDDLSGYDPVVFGDATLVDILHCKRGIDGELLLVAKRFHKKLTSNYSKGRRELYELQQKLWELEGKLNTLFDERIRLEKGWLDQPSYELAHLFVRMMSRRRVLKEELATMETKFGKAEDLRKQITELHSQIPTYPLPRWLDRFNAEQVHGILESLKRAIETERRRPALEVRKKREAEVRAQHELEMKRINDERNARRDARKAELDEILRPYTETVTKLLEHPVFRTVSIKLPKLGLDRFTVEFQLGTLGEEGYKLLLDKARTEIAMNQRKLREPMRRAHQSAQSRGLTKLAFEAYLKQEGFGHLLP